MALEIERKFTISIIPWRDAKGYVDIVQGYLSIDPRASIRVRIQTSPDGSQEAYFTAKGRTTGITRIEHEYQIPVADASEMLEHMCVATIEKRRYFLNHDNHEWSVDVFAGRNHGLWLAEIELLNENESWTAPSWLLKDVTNDSRYVNANLAINPYQLW